MICTVFVLRAVLKSQRILLYPISWAHYKELGKDKGTLQGTSKYFWHVDLELSLQELQVTFWYCTAQYASTGCNCMGSFVLLRLSGTVLPSVRFYRLQLHGIFCSTGCNCARSFVVKLQPQRNKEIEID
jgi:hypothetical protein